MTKIQRAVQSGFLVATLSAVAFTGYLASFDAIDEGPAIGIVMLRGIDTSPSR